MTRQEEYLHVVHEPDENDVHLVEWVPVRSIKPLLDANW